MDEPEQTEQVVDDDDGIMTVEELGDYLTRDVHVLSCLFGLLASAHTLVEACIEGRPMRAYTLETYYSEWKDITAYLSLDGMSIEGLLKEIEKVLDLG